MLSLFLQHFKGAIMCTRPSLCWRRNQIQPRLLENSFSLFASEILLSLHLVFTCILWWNYLENFPCSYAMWLTDSFLELWYPWFIFSGENLSHNFYNYFFWHSIYFLFVFKEFSSLFFKYVWVFCLLICLCSPMCASCPQRLEEGII